MKITSIDPGTRHIGVALFENNQLVFWHTQEKMGVAKSGLISTIKFICSKIKDFNPDFIVFEDYAEGAVVFNKEEAEVMGLFYAYLIGSRIALLPIKTIKSIITGMGRAKKNRTINVISELYKMPKKQLDSHSADAISIGLVFQKYLNNELNKKQTELIKRRIFNI